MIAGTRQKTIGGTSYHNDPLYAFGKAFTEACQNILTTESYDLFAEPSRAIRSKGVRESLREFFVDNFVNEADVTKTPEQIEEEVQDAEALFENDMSAIQESAYASEYQPMVGMALPIHKLILMNNVFAQGGGIQKATAVQPAFTVSMERRILVTPTGDEIDMFLQQNQIYDAIESTAPIKEYEISLPEKETTDVLGDLGGGIGDELSVESHISGILIKDVYIAPGDRLPDAEGWFSTKGEIATEETAGTKDVWYHVNIPFTPSYGGPNRLERILSKPITIK